MFEWLPIPLQVYLFSLVLGTALPLIIFWMIRPALVHFLTAIFREEPIVAFWQRQILLVLLLAGLAAAVRYRASADVLSDAVAIVFSASDALQAILENVLYALFALFLPLLLAYTVLHAGRPRAAGPGSG
jgi:hypothetical protein